MSNFSIEKLAGEPIIVITHHADFSFERDLAESNTAAFELIDNATEPLAYIIDTREVSYSIEDFARAAAVSIHGKTSTFNHANVKLTVVISDVPLVELAARGVNTDPFGNLKVPVVRTYEEALDMARGE